MKAIFRFGAGLFGLLLAASISQAQYYNWRTPVLKCPYPQAPDTYNSGFYLVDAYGRCTGPNYYLVPPFSPYNGPVCHHPRGGAPGQGAPQAGTMPPGGAGQPMPNPFVQMPYPQQFGAFGAVGQMQPFQQFGQFAPMQPMGWPPHQPAVGGGAYPTHPFTRSPRDFFLWGEMMEEERARGNRPFPVP
jgi:hypothetical protein